MSKTLRGKRVQESLTAVWIKLFARRRGATDVMSPHKGNSQCRSEGLLGAHCRERSHGPLLTCQRFCPRAHQKDKRVVKGDDAENTLRRYESLTHFRPVGVKSVCGGCLACGLSARSWRVEPPFPLRHLSCLSAAQVHGRRAEQIKITYRE